MFSRRGDGPRHQNHDDRRHDDRRGDRRGDRERDDRGRREEARQLESARYMSEMKRHAAEEWHRRQHGDERRYYDFDGGRRFDRHDQCDNPGRREEDRRDKSASAILGAATAKQLLGGGTVEPLQDVLSSRATTVTNKIAEALITYRFTGKNAGNSEKLVDRNNQINKHRVREEYNQIVFKGPKAIRWAKENGKLNMDVVDPRLVDEVMNRPNLPDAVKERVWELLLEKAVRIRDEGDDEE